MTGDEEAELRAQVAARNAELQRERAGKLEYARTAFISIEALKRGFHDPGDAVAMLPRDVAPEDVQDAIDALLRAKPYLAAKR